MNKKILFLFLFLLKPAFGEVLDSDWQLLKDTPMLDMETTDPYWNLAWHGKVASYGDPESQFFVAQVYEQGKLVPRNLTKAIEFYKKAALQEHIESCMHLAKLLPEEAENWYLIAARINSPQAQIKLSQLYEKQGKTEEAVLWLEKALKIMFPNTSDLTSVSPDLKRLKGL
jgi:tetratricopeptide (TPR) repeat protein